jgi:hypothetical protein
MLLFGGLVASWKNVKATMYDVKAQTHYYEIYIKLQYRDFCIVNI